MEKRVKLIRKSLNLSQKEFGDRLGLKPNSISSIETGINTLTEQNIKMICSTFQINEEWLRTGNGEMYTKHLKFDNELSRVINEIVKSDDIFVKRFLTAYWNLSKENRAVISDFMDKLSSEQ